MNEKLENTIELAIVSCEVCGVFQVALSGGEWEEFSLDHEY